MINIKELLTLNTVQMKDYSEKGLDRYRKYFREKFQSIKDNQEEIDCLTINEYYNSLPQCFKTKAFNYETLVRVIERVEEDYATEYECCDYDKPEKMFAITRQNALIITTHKIKQYYHIGKDGIEVIEKEIVLKENNDII